MALTNMKMSPEEAKEEYGAAPDVSNAPQYPYGLTLSLCDESMAQLGMTTLPAVGSKVMITAMATVTSTSSDSRQDGDTEKRVGLQITDMELGADAGKSAAATLYGDDA
jgi:hypothetical protein